VFSGILDPVHSLLVSNFRNERNLSAQSSAGRKWVMTCLSLWQEKTASEHAFFLAISDRVEAGNRCNPSSA
jgi:hypothetical protein